MDGLHSPNNDDGPSNNPSLYDENMADAEEEEEGENESSYNTAMPGYVKKAVAVHEESEGGFSVADNSEEIKKESSE